MRYALDSSKIKKLGWQPKVSFEDGLRRTVEWYLNHQDWVEKVISLCSGDVIFFERPG